MSHSPPPGNDTLLQRNHDVVAADLDGELVMMNAGKGSYYGISGVGTRAFELLSSPVSINGLVEAITQEYEVTPETCRQDITKFVQELMKNDIIRPAN
ncbi:PqqD family peptide modification chaperone [Halomonas salinarum]|uniref:PqqD family peptide modification chaperone n=1 Tax=Halomonas salinarum TaxID=1158993 RepID=UPI001439007F|nr:PqqD family peptide modification chaperone [Halomonas salinarum]